MWLICQLTVLSSVKLGSFLILLIVSSLIARVLSLSSLGQLLVLRRLLSRFHVLLPNKSRRFVIEVMGLH